MKIILKVCLLVFLFFYSQLADAQLFDDVFVFKNVQPDISLDAKQTGLRGLGVQLIGLRAGMQWQKKYKAGLGYYFMSSKVDEKVNYQGTEVPARLNFSFISAYGEYTFYHSNKWTLNAGLQPAIGRKYNEYFFPAGGSETLDNDFFFSAEPYINGNYKILYWVGLGGGLGYRQVLIGYPLSAYRLNGPEINFNVVIFFGELFNKYILKKEPE